MRFPFHIVGPEVPDGIVTISPDGLVALVPFPPTYLSNDDGPNDCAADNDRRMKTPSRPGRFRSMWRKNAKS